MKTNLNPKGNTRLRLIVIGSVVLFLLIVSALAGVLFPGSLFATIVDQSVGKFFNIVQFFIDNYVRLLESATIVFFMWVIEKALTVLIHALSRNNSRSQTVGDLFRSIVKYGSVLVGIFLILAAWGVQTGTLLAGAGILGLALSFGAQSLIEDVISGLFIIFERQFQVGDIIQVDNFRGTVVEIGIRASKFEDINGDIKILNNSDIRGAINTSAHLSPAIADISVSYGEDIKKVEAILIPALENIKAQIPRHRRRTVLPRRAIARRIVGRHPRDREDPRTQEISSCPRSQPRFKIVVRRAQNSNPVPANRCPLRTQRRIGQQMIRLAETTFFDIMGL
ncbi:MAG: mechanosensitive ion channel family protein [Bacillus subtilis]|nr:mechanosensitive ion channel family protein [Bacillus subtilis]